MGTEIDVFGAVVPHTRLSHLRSAVQTLDRMWGVESCSPMVGSFQYRTVTNCSASQHPLLGQQGLETKFK